MDRNLLADPANRNKEEETQRKPEKKRSESKGNTPSKLVESLSLAEKSKCNISNVSGILFNFTDFLQRNINYNFGPAAAAAAAVNGNALATAPARDKVSFQFTLNHEQNILFGLACPTFVAYIVNVCVCGCACGCGCGCSKGQKRNLRLWQ